MPLPDGLRPFVLKLIDLRREAGMLAADVMSQASSSPEPSAAGLEAYAKELVQVSKVLGNYTKLLDREIGDLNFLESEIKEWENTEDVLSRLLLEFEGLMNKSRLTELTPEEDARYRALSSGLGRPITE